MQILYDVACLEYYYYQVLFLKEVHKELTDMIQNKEETPSGNLKTGKLIVFRH
jgi:hypothetical protein